MNEMKVANRAFEVYEWVADRVVKGVWDAAHFSHPYPCSTFKDMDGIGDLGWRVEIEEYLRRVFLSAGVVAAFVRSEMADGEGGRAYDPLMAFGAAAIIGDVGVLGIVEKAKDLLRKVGVQDDEGLEFGLIEGGYAERYWGGVRKTGNKDGMFVHKMARVYFLDGVSYALKNGNRAGNA